MCVCVACSGVDCMCRDALGALDRLAAMFALICAVCPCAMVAQGMSVIYPVEMINGRLWNPSAATGLKCCFRHTPCGGVNPLLHWQRWNCHAYIDCTAAAQALLLLEEMASVVVTPFVLYFSLPKCAPEILKFVRSFTTHVEGVGDICSLSAFDFQRHGNVKYGSPLQAPKVPPLKCLSWLAAPKCRPGTSFFGVRISHVSCTSLVGVRFSHVSCASCTSRHCIVDGCFLDVHVFMMSLQGLQEGVSPACPTPLPSPSALLPTLWVVRPASRDYVGEELTTSREMVEAEYILRRVGNETGGTACQAGCGQDRRQEPC